LPRIFHQPPRDACAPGAECHFCFCIETTFAETVVEEKSLCLLLQHASVCRIHLQKLSKPLDLAVSRQPPRDACDAGRARHPLGV
jgi:hypothetical protein